MRGFRDLERAQEFLSSFGPIRRGSELRYTLNGAWGTRRQWCPNFHRTASMSQIPAMLLPD